MCRLLSEFGLTHFFPLVVLASPSVEHPEKERIKAVVRYFVIIDHLGERAWQKVWYYL